MKLSPIFRLESFAICVVFAICSNAMGLSDWAGGPPVDGSVPPQSEVRSRSLWSAGLHLGASARRVYIMSADDNAAPSLSRLISAGAIGQAQASAFSSPQFGLELRRPLLYELELGTEVIIQSYEIRHASGDGSGLDMMVSLWVEPDSGLWVRSRVGARARRFGLGSGGPFANQGQLGIAAGLTLFSNPSWRLESRSARSHWSADIEVATMAIGLGSLDAGVLRDSSSLRLRLRRTGSGEWPVWVEAQFFHLHRAYFGASSSLVTKATFVDDLSLGLNLGTDL